MNESDNPATDPATSEAKATLADWLDARDAFYAAKERLDKLGAAANTAMTKAKLQNVAIENRGKSYMVTTKGGFKATELKKL